MAREYTNEDAGFDDVSLYNVPVRKQDSGATSKVQQAALTGKADAAVAAPASAPVASAAVIPPLDAASAPPLPDIKNPAQDGDFWKSALPYLAAPALGLLGGAAYSGIKGRGGSGGGSVGAPAVDDDLRQLRLAQEQAKLDSIYEKNYRQQQLHEANLARLQPKSSAAGTPSMPIAESGMPSTSQQFSVQQKPVDYSLTGSSAYGQQKINAPTGAPNVAAPPPVEAPVAAVQPKPMTEIERLRVEKLQFDLEAARAKEARAQEAHASRLAADAKRAGAKNQTKQGTPTQNLETTMQKQSYENTVSKAVDANMKAAAVKKAPPAASVVPPAASPTATTTTAPVVEVAPATAPKTSGVKEISLPKEWPSKGMNWLTSQYGEDGARQFINQYNKGEPFKTHDDMKKVYDQVMTKPSFSTMPKDLRKSRGITTTPDYQQYKIVPNAIVPPTLPSGGGGGGMIVPRGGVGNVPGANEQVHSLNPLKL
jgi:hypothetical protein